MRRFTITTLAVAALLGGCTDEILNGDNGSGGDFAISVSGGTRPNYSWTAGPAFEIAVARTSNLSVVVWRVADVNDQAIASPVRHGVVPAGAIETVASERVLSPGVQYRVSIRLADGSSAYRDFIP